MATGQVSRSPNLAEVIRQAIEYRLADVHTSIPGRVEKIDTETQTVDVKPLIKRQYANPDGSEVIESLPVIPRIPLSFPRAGKYYITWPIKKGDLVELVFTESSRDNYKAGSGKEIEPDDFRRFDLSDAYAIPGAYPESKAIRNFDAENLSLGVDGGATIVIKEDGNISVIPSGSGVANIGADSGSQFIARLNDLVAADVTMQAFLLQLIGLVNYLGPLLNAGPGIPLVSGGTGTVPGVLPAVVSDFGKISTAASKAKAT